MSVTCGDHLEIRATLANHKHLRKMAPMILTTETYDVLTADGRFALFLSSHSDKTWYAGVLVYRRTEGGSQGADVNIRFDMQNFVNTSQSAAFDEAVIWVKKTIDSNAVIIKRDDETPVAP